MYRVELPGYRVDEVKQTLDQVVIKARRIHPTAACPSCGSISQQIHSHYMRHPRDIPMLGQQVQLHLLTRRFKCDEPTCPKQTFAEQHPQFLPRYARRTQRFTQQVSQVALASSALQGARVCRQLALPTSGRTLLRILHAIPLPAKQGLAVIGIDDWAWLKGRRYGTIICDLERHCVVDLLPDTELATITGWLGQHPAIKVIARDRSTTFADAINQIAPHVQQVADRWHLIHSLANAAEQVLKGYRASLTVKELATTATPLPQDFPIGSSNRARSKTANETRREQLGS